MADTPFIFTQDRLVRNILKRMADRAEEGCVTYGGTMEAADKPFDKWIEDTQEELMDAVVYLEKVRLDYLKALSIVKKTEKK